MSQLKLGREVVLKDSRRVKLRTYKPSDLDALVYMYSSLSEETLRWSLPPYDRQKIERWTSDLPNKIILVGLSEGRVVGHLLITIFPNQRFRGIGELIIYVHQEFQNAGLGAAMITEAVSLSRARGLHRVGLSVVADNNRAIRLYEKMGFLKEGVRRHSYFGMDGVYHEQVDMGLLLRARRPSESLVIITAIFSTLTLRRWLLLQRRTMSRNSLSPSTCRSSTRPGNRSNLARCTPRDGSSRAWENTARNSGR